MKFTLDYTPIIALPFLSRDAAVEIRKLPLPDGKRRIETLMNDGTLRVNVVWRNKRGETQFNSHESKPGDCAQWLSPDDAYTSILKRDPRTGDWVTIRAE